MDLDTFEELTGTSVTDSRRARVVANIERCRAKLETKLGYPLDPDKVATNLYTESGKLPGDGFFALSVDFDSITLDPADAVVGAYRLFNYHPADQYLHIDPFSAIHAVKLVRGSVTLWTLDSDDYSAHADNGGLMRYLDLTWPLWRTSATYGIDGQEHVQLAVDADWLWPATDGNQDIPADLLYVWADMVEHYANAKRLVKSETVGSHSYTRDITAPEDSAEATATIARYAGGNGSASRMPL
jgi:hypothetical protein